jgi:hypothetical protein
MEAVETSQLFSQMRIKLWKIKELLTLGACTDKHGKNRLEKREKTSF